jgi:hypothetical protein
MNFNPIKKLLKNYRGMSDDYFDFPAVLARFGFTLISSLLASKIICKRWATNFDT